MMNRLSMPVIWSFSFSSTSAIIDQYSYICSIMKGQISMLHRLAILFEEQIFINFNKQNTSINRIDLPFFLLLAFFFFFSFLMTISIFLLHLRYVFILRHPPKTVRIQSIDTHVHTHAKKSKANRGESSIL